MAFIGCMVIAILILTFLLAIRPEDAVNSTSMDSQGVIVQEGITEDTTDSDAEETTVSEDVEQEVSQDSLNNKMATSSEVTMLRAKDSVNVRSQESADGEKLGTLSKGEEVELVEELASGWTKIKYNGTEAYIKSEYLEAVSE